MFMNLKKLANMALNKSNPLRSQTKMLRLHAIVEISATHYIPASVSLSTKPVERKGWKLKNSEDDFEWCIMCHAAKTNDLSTHHRSQSLSMARQMNSIYMIQTANAPQSVRAERHVFCLCLIA
jgi:hypothetical protein